VALLDPVPIGGVEVSRASLHNQREIERKDIRIGDRVVVERAGDVIPYVVKSVKEERDGSEKRFQIPGQCPVCGTDVVTSKDRKQARCPNPDCSAQLRDSLTHYGSREAMDIEGIGEKCAQQLIDAGLVESLADIYRLSKDELVSLDRFAAKSAQNLLDEIEESKESTLPRFLYALGIPLVGLHLADVLAQRFGTLDELMDASGGDLREIEEVGPKVAQSVASFFGDTQNREMIEAMRQAGLRLSNPYDEHGGTPLAGITFVFTGELDRWTRDEVKRYVQRLGGRATSSVSGETDHVVAGPGTGSKLDEAQQRGIPVLDEDAFAELADEQRRT
jgi:DNA ligase (NAD+)